MDGLNVIIVSGLFLLFLFLWFYHKYELDRIKKDFISDNQNTKSEMLQQSKNPDLHQQVDKSINQNGCLTGYYEVRNCFFADEDKIQNENRVDEFHASEAITMLLPKINRTIFCEHACKEKGSCGNKNNNLNPLITFNKDKHELESLWDYFLETPVHIEGPINGKSVSDNVVQAVKSQSIVQPFGSISSLKDEEFLRQVFRLIQYNFADYRYSVEILSKGLNMSVSQVNRRLNSLTGFPAGHYIRLFRLRNAALLLIRKAGSITDICFKCGFNELGYFSRAFKKQFGCSPTVYKKLMTRKFEYHAFIG